jgi:hypothetical protein
MSRVIPLSKPTTVKFNVWSWNELSPKDLGVYMSASSNDLFATLALAEDANGVGSQDELWEAT